MKDLILHKELSFAVIGLCMEVHNALGRGLSEIVYKSALELEFLSNGINFEREKAFKIAYKETILPHKYYADFIVEEKIILEIKAASNLTDNHLRQTLNYLAISKLHLGLLVNFGEQSLSYKRIVF